MLWRKRVTAIASEYPDIELSHMYVDNAAMQLVRNPKQVSDTFNLFFGQIMIFQVVDLTLLVTKIAVRYNCNK